MDIREQGESVRGDREDGGVEVVRFVGERVEVETEPVTRGSGDGEAVGGGDGKDAGCLEKRGRIGANGEMGGGGGGDARRSGEADGGSGAIREPKAAVEGCITGGAAVEEVAERWREVPERGDEPLGMEEKDQDSGEEGRSEGHHKRRRGGGGGGGGNDRPSTEPSCPPTIFVSRTASA